SDVSISSINHHCNNQGEFKCDKRKTSVSIEPRFIRITTLIDDPHPTSI
ncbi:16549_t:CDS:1, partial [Racocetra fulgida]